MDNLNVAKALKTSLKADDKVESLNISYDLIYNEIIRFYKYRNEKNFNYFIEKSIKKSKQAKKI